MKFDCTTEKYADLYARWLVDPSKLLKLGSLKPGERVIDLCGGTGVVGQEALDWGASYVVVADLNPRIRRWSDGRLQPIIARAESIDVSMRVVEDRLAALRGKPPSDRDDLDKPFDLVVCRQAIGYLNVATTARAVANVLRPDGRFVFNAFKKPKFALKLYTFEGQHFLEASGFFGRTVMHVQASPTIGFDVTRFRWHTEMDLDRALSPFFEIGKSSTEKSLYYVCRKRRS